MGRAVGILLVTMARNAAIMLAAIIFSISSMANAQTVNAADYDAFWLWAGVTPQPVLNKAKTVYLIQGQIEVPAGKGERSVQMIAQGGAISQIKNKEIWIVYRAHTLRWTPAIYAQILARLKRWQAKGNAVKGIQIDFDSSTRHLNEYADFLRDLRMRLPSDQALSITGLLDWNTDTGIANLNLMSDVVDEIILQTYQGRRTIPNYQSYLSHTDRIHIAFKVGLMQDGDWQAPAGLEDSPMFRGYVVFLKN
jgi:Protein of unknown function (DUF3142)